MRTERGAAAVELAIVASFLLVLVFGVIDIGRVLFTRIAVIDAAQEGAVFAAFEDRVAGTPLDRTHIEDRVMAAIDNPTLTAGDITITCYVDTSGSRSSYEIEVVVEHDVDLVTPFLSQAYPSIHLEKSARSARYLSDCPTNTTTVTT